MGNKEEKGDGEEGEREGRGREIRKVKREVGEGKRKENRYKEGEGGR